MRTLAVFHSKQSRHWANRWLKRGFWHVFVCVCDGPAIEPKLGRPSGYWVRLDAQDGAPAVEVVAPSNFDLAGFYRENGLTVVEVETPARPPLWPLMAANCVGMAKLVLGIRAPWVVTPYGLFQHLLKRQTSVALEMQHAD